MRETIDSLVKVSLDDIKDRDLTLSPLQQLLDDMPTQEAASANNEI
jgi:hypothetical protein